MIFEKINTVLNPAPPVGGLEISNSAIRFVQIKRGKIKKVSLKLPPGIVVDGRISDRRLFIQALQNLHKQIERAERPVHVVLVLPSQSVYTQVFSIPAVRKSKIREAARLNLQMISPIDINKAYYDYKLFNNSLTANGQLQLFGAFVQSAIVDDFTEALKKTLFIPVAIEFPALALARLIRHNKLLDKNRSYLIINLTDDGVAIIIIKNFDVYFHYFTDWDTVNQEGDLSGFIVRETKRVISFYTNRGEGSIDDLVLITHIIDREVNETLARSFPKLKIRSLILGDLSDISPIWFNALGAAFRGLTPRFRDRSITLTPIGVEEEYFHSFTINFIHMWRNIIFSVLAILIIIFFVSDVFLARFSVSRSKELALLPRPISSTETDALIKQAKEFNNFLDSALSAAEKSPAWSRVFKKIQLIARQNGTSLDRVSLGSDLTILVGGRSKSEKSVLDFKNSIAAEPDFDNVSLPLTNITVRSDGVFVFSMTFKIINLPDSSSQ